MLNINFVPDDYVQNNESKRTNLIYLFLFLVTMIAIGGTFTAIRMRYRSVLAKELLVNQRLAKTQEAIKQFEDLQNKRKSMVKTALMTAELLEPIPRSILLASLTNNLPPGASLLRIKVIQKEPQKALNAKPVAKGPGGPQAKQGTATEAESPEKRMETNIDIEGIAPSDLQVAVYLEKLSMSSLLDNVALVESKEYIIKPDGPKQSAATNVAETVVRQFKLTAVLKKDVQITQDEIKKIACDTVVIR